MRRSLLTRTALVSLGLFALLLVVLVTSLLVGTSAVSVTDFFVIGWGGDDSNRAWTILTSYRLPRSLLAAIAGAGLASAGVVFQAVLRNPLADPYLIGIAGGGSLGAVISIVMFGQQQVMGTSLCAFVGSLVAVGLVYGLATARGRAAQVNTLILAGVIVGALMNALMMLLISVSGSDEMQRIMFWLMGDFSLADYHKIRIAAVITVLGWTVIYLNANRLNLLIIGDETAHNLGLNVFWIRSLFIGAAALITGTVVSVSGTIGFVGLVVPHAMRLLFGPDSRILLPAAFLGGASFVAVSDLVARLVAYPVELPVGVITALTGAPFFLYLLMRK